MASIVHNYGVAILNAGVADHILETRNDGISGSLFVHKESNLVFWHMQLVQDECSDRRRVVDASIQIGNREVLFESEQSVHLRMLADTSPGQFQL